MVMKMTFLEHLQTFMDKDEAIKLNESLNNQPIHCFRLNSLKRVGEGIIDLTVLQKHQHVNDAYIYDKEKFEFGKNILFEAGAYYIQEPAAMMVTYLLDIKPNDYVLDMCAAPGGKSFNALVDMNDQGLLVCNDIHEIRSKVLSSNIEKYGFKNAIVLNEDSKKYKKYFLSFFDKIILDAPCSGSAMFRKNKRAVEEWSIEKVYQCKLMQLSLIEDAYDMLKDNGLLLYSTCSFSIQENEEVIQEFINKHHDMEIVNIELNKDYNDTISLNGGLRLYPFKFAGEGQTIFILKKRSLKSLKKSNLMKCCKNIKEIIKFLDSINFKYNKEDIVFINNKYYLAEFKKIDLSHLKVLRYGLELGEMQKDRFIPSHSLAMYHDLDKNTFIDLNKKEALIYLKGLTINKEGNEGYKVVSYNDLALGWIKQVNGILKNHYPKGLRKNFE